MTESVKKPFIYEICYTDDRGNRVTGQYGDAAWVGSHLKNLEDWGATDIVVTIYKEQKNEEVITEAPDEDGIMNDDELDAEEQRERDELEARFKARRDKVAQQRADRDIKVARENELKAKADEIIAQIGDDWSFDHLFDLLVPQSGKCETLAGEIIRAANKIDYRWFNDGDRFFEGYGIETCGQPAYFLMNIELNDETPLWNFLIDCAENDTDNEDYDAFLDELKNKVISLIKDNPSLLAMETKDMYDSISYRDVEDFFEDNNMVPKYDVDCSLPRELEDHLDVGNISERELIWEIESWIDNIGDARYSDITYDWGNIYVNDCNRAVYEELDGGSTLYSWLEQYAQELTNEYGDPNEKDDDWAESIADELGQDVDMVQHVLNTHSFDSYDDARDYIAELIDEQGNEDTEGGEN